ncbi:MAG TPA: patatin-like phospholipase family protein, partial [Steroidobacteraceae bacterium]
KIWSSELTPDDPVAFAVRCSSSLPFFFQATVQGDSRFVDGGLLANLPAFVYKLDSAAAKDSFCDPILAFCLEEAPSPPAQWTPLLLLKQIISAVVDGSTDLHLRLDRNVHRISIPTLGVRATDFDRMTPQLSQNLIDSGRRSTLEFFRNENTRSSAAANSTSVCLDEYQTFLAIVQEGLRPAIEILIACRDSVWTWKLFPTLLNWLRSGSKVRIALPPITSTGNERKKEEHRRQTLVSLGVQVVEVPAVEVCAFAFRRQDPRWISAVMLDSEPSEYKPHSVRYEGYVHQGVLDALTLRLQALFPPGNAIPAKAALELREEDPSVLISLLKKGVREYGKQTVSLTVEDLPLTKIDLIVHKLRAYKYRQIESLVRAYQEHDLPLFTPAVLNHPSGEQSFVTPPVVELHGDRYVVIEGNTRTYFCYRANIRTIRCLVARGVSDALPGKPVSIARTLISSAYVPADKRIENFNYAQFRRIEGAIRQPQLAAK